MRALQIAHDAAANSAYVQGAGVGILPARHPAKLNGEGRRADVYDTLRLKVEKPDVATTARPRPVRGRRASDQRPTAFPHPSQLKPQTPFMAQLMSQDRLPVVVASHVEGPSATQTASDAKPAVKVTEADLVSAQRRHFEQVNAYRKTVTMATDFIIRRYHLATDFQGLMINNSRTVEMLV